MSADPGAVLKAGMDGGPALPGDEDEVDLDEVSELEKFHPTRVDGVNGPANGCPTLMLKALGSGRGRASAPIVTRVVKTTPEKRVSVHLAYPSMRPDRARAADGFRDFAGPDAVQDAAWSFMKSGARVGLFHEDGTTGAGTTVESWVHRADPWTIKAVDGSSQTIMPGDWLVAIQWPPDTWELVKSGVINGVSMQGSALRRRPSPEALAALRKGKGGKRARRLAKAQERAVSRALQPALVEAVLRRCAEVARAGCR